MFTNNFSKKEGLSNGLQSPQNMLDYSMKQRIPCQYRFPLISSRDTVEGIPTQCNVIWLMIDLYTYSWASILPNFTAVKYLHKILAYLLKNKLFMEKLVERYTCFVHLRMIKELIISILLYVDGPQRHKEMISCLPTYPGMEYQVLK